MLCSKCTPLLINWVNIWRPTKLTLKPDFLHSRKTQMRSRLTQNRSRQIQTNSRQIPKRLRQTHKKSSLTQRSLKQHRSHPNSSRIWLRCRFCSNRSKTSPISLHRSRCSSRNIVLSCRETLNCGANYKTKSRLNTTPSKAFLKRPMTRM